MKQIITRILKKAGKIGMGQIDLNLKPLKTDTSLQIQQCILYQLWSNNNKVATIEEIWNAGFSNFSQFEEDGIFLFIFSKIGMGNRLCIEVGCDDGINSNTANLLLNWGWYGVLIDGNEAAISKGSDFYSKHKNTWLYPPKLKSAFVNAENINELLSGEFKTTDVDLMSIDIDGNDFWVWKALNVVKPKVVVLETRIEFGENSVVVPYDPNFCYPSPKHNEYYGSSILAMTALAQQKGYRLIGANRYGFNAIYMRDDVGRDAFPEVSVNIILSHPRNNEKTKIFDEVKHLEFVKI